MSTTDPVLQTAFDNTIWYLLTLWPPLKLALSESWAGDATSDKRDWLAGCISDLFDSRPQTDALDIEDVLLQVMADEFDIEVQDDSGVPVAEEIMRVRLAIVGEGRTEVAEEVKRRYEERKGVKSQFRYGGEEVEEGDSEEEMVDGEGDEEMGEAPALVRAEPRQKEEPEVDEEGFTKVVGRKKR